LKPAVLLVLLDVWYTPQEQHRVELEELLGPGWDFAYFVESLEAFWIEVKGNSISLSFIVQNLCRMLGTKIVQLKVSACAMVYNRAWPITA
jgi:hypothetical protein